VLTRAVRSTGKLSHGDNPVNARCVFAFLDGFSRIRRKIAEYSNHHPSLKDGEPQGGEMKKRKITAAVTAAGIALFAGAANADTIPERLMRDLGRDFHLKDFQAAGVVGNLARETGNFRFMQELKPVVTGSRGGIGYSQWTGSRRVAFEEYAGSADNQLTYEVNYGYLKKELSEDYADVMDEVRGSKNLWESTVLFMRGYLRPKDNEKNIRVSMNYANGYLAGDFSGSGCQAQHEVRIDGRRMTIAACPEATIDVAGMSVEVVFADNMRPRPRPNLPDQPEYRSAIREMVVAAIDSEASAKNPSAKPPARHSASAGDEEPDPLLAWDPFFARRENEPTDYGPYL
jgi:hypothetical protein